MIYGWLIRIYICLKIGKVLLLLYCSHAEYKKVARNAQILRIFD